MENNTESHSFRPKARLLLLLGNQLIRDSKLAVFELVKNAFDADATKVDIRMINIENRKHAKIIVEDNGFGMDYETIRDVWLVPGTDRRSEKRKKKERKLRFNRIPLGEKGVGRFAVHKLGSSIRLITRMKGESEYSLTINWTDFEEDAFLDELFVKIRKQKPEIFKAGRKGTRLVISDLRQDWTKRDVRSLYRSIMSICSPFDTPAKFIPKMWLEPESDWLENLIDIKEMMERSIFKAECKIVNNKLDYEYFFNPPDDIVRIEKREEHRKGAAGIPLPREMEMSKEMEEYHIGPITINLYMWDLSLDILSRITTDISGTRLYLRENGGIRVYRDGMRVFDYGEPENDWLELDQKRYTTPSSTISNNLVIGAVSLESSASKGLVEKTNREGFVENKFYRRFKEIVQWAVSQIEQERTYDKNRLRLATSKKELPIPILDEIYDLQKEFKIRNLEDELNPYLDRISKTYIQMRDQLLTAAGSGLGLIVVIHEVEIGVAELKKAVERKASLRKITSLVKHLDELVRGLGYLSRKTGRRTIKASVLIRRAVFNTSYRLKYHNIQLVNGIKEGISRDFSIKCTSRFIIATIMNLIDNSIYWLDQKGGENKTIYIGTCDYLGNPAIIISDNGPGFMDSPEKMVEPFWSRKKEGMGLGLYLAKQIMEAHGGVLEFPDSEEVVLYEGISKAIVALVFKKGN